MVFSSGWGGNPQKNDQGLERVFIAEDLHFLAFLYKGPGIELCFLKVFGVFQDVSGTLFVGDKNTKTGPFVEMVF